MNEKQSETIIKLISDLIEFQMDKDLPTLNKDSMAGDPNTKFNFKYTSLDNYLKLRPLLNKHNLTFIQTIKMNDDFTPIVVTTLFHKSGEYISSELGIKPLRDNNSQEIGKVIGYAKRYTLAAMLGIPCKTNGCVTEKQRIEKYKDAMIKYTQELTVDKLNEKINSMPINVLSDLGFGDKQVREQAIKFYNKLKGEIK